MLSIRMHNTYCHDVAFCSVCNILLPFLCIYITLLILAITNHCYISMNSEHIYDDIIIQEVKKDKLIKALSTRVWRKMYFLYIILFLFD